MSTASVGKRRSKRWKCPHCKREGWSGDGRVPVHDLPWSTTKICRRGAPPDTDFDALKNR